MKTKFAWLVEDASSETSLPSYLTFTGGKFEWTTDALKATRFTSREQAERVAVTTLGNYHVRVAEHGWG